MQAWAPFLLRPCRSSGSTLQVLSLLGVWEKRRDTVLFVTHNVDEAVFLSDQILVLSKRPGRISKVFDVALQSRETGRSWNTIESGGMC